MPDFSTESSIKKPTFVCSVAKAGNAFVGLKYEKNELEIVFPMGYNIVDSENPEFEFQSRKDILNLISVLSSYGDEENKGHIDQDSNDTKEQNLFPIHSYLYICSDFLTHGYYVETDVIYRKSNSGKINWPRTIKHIEPNVCENGVFYSNFVTRKVNYNENELITKVHQWCVYQSFLKIGFLFCSFLPQKPALEFNKELFKSVVLSKMSETFNEKSMMLMQNMLNIIEYKDKSKDAKTETFGTYEFENSWEGMVESIYGTEDKTKFYPQGLWITDREYPDSELMPDSIMKTAKDDKRIFVIDSKYYQRGLDQRKNYGLPHTADMLKQVAYGEFVEHLGNDGTNVYNVFLMPYNAKENTSSPKYTGFAKLKWKEPKLDKQYRKIHGVLLDTRWVMENCTVKNYDAIEKLAQIIEDNKVK